jgi:malate permease and related proteins
MDCTFIDIMKVGLDMALAITAFNQIVIMFFIILVGVICYKTKLIDRESNKRLADLVLMLVNPLVIIISYQREFKASLLSGLLISLILALITHIVAILISLVTVRGKMHNSDLPIERFAVIYSNCAFIGIPLVFGILGSEGVFYLTAYMTVFNLAVWTHGMITMSGKNDRKSIIKALLSPSVLATVLGFVLFMCRIILPEVLNKPITYIGNMNTPLAMLVAGATIAQTNVLKIFTKVRVYYIAFLKLLLIPVIMLLFYRIFHMPEIVLLTTVLACACPTAATINLFSIRFEKNYLYASELFTITTILSIMTIPLVMIIANMIV